MNSKVAFLVKTYPKLSETFILGEILGLERLGTALAIFALQPPTDTMAHAQVRAVRAPVTYLPPLQWRSIRQISRDHLAVLVRRPLGYLRSLRAACQEQPGERRTTFLKAVSLAAALLRAQIKHVHAHFASEPASVAALAVAMINGSFSISAHAKDIYLADPHALGRKLRAARFTVTCTEYNHRHLQSLGGPGALVHRMYHGVDLVRFAPAIDAAAEPLERAPTILSVGRLREKKGFPTLIDACAVLARRKLRFQCQIIGYGPDEARLRARIAEHGLAEQVHLLGKLAHGEVIAAYRSATVFVLPCQVGTDGDRDGIPNVLLEAMAMRLPIITTPISGIPEVVRDRVNGLLVAPEDPVSLAESIAEVFVDGDLRAALGRNARATVSSQFDNATNLQLVRNLLDRLTNPGQVPTTPPDLLEERNVR